MPAINILAVTTLDWTGILKGNRFNMFSIYWWENRFTRFPTSYLVQATSDSLSTMSELSPFVVSPSTSTPFTVFTKLQFSELQHKECDLLIYKPAYMYSYTYAYTYTLEVGQYVYVYVRGCGTWQMCCPPTCVCAAPTSTTLPTSPTSPTCVCAAPPGQQWCCLLARALSQPGQTSS